MSGSLLNLNQSAFSSSFAGASQTPSAYPTSFAGASQTASSYPTSFSGISQLPTSGTQVIGPSQSVNQPAVFGPPAPANLTATPAPTADTRVRLAALNPAQVYNNSKFPNSILSILNSTNGMLFPYTPSITFNQTVDYMNLQLVHSDTDYQAYTRTPSVKLAVNGKFTVQNPNEGVYALAVIHFLRTVSKSYFGETDAAAGKAGLPPPVLLFSGYGNYMFGTSTPAGGLRCILTSHSWTFDDTVDMIPLTVQGGVVKLPSLFTIQCDLTVIQTPTRMRTQFSFDQFASGALMQGNSGWI